MTLLTGGKEITSVALFRLVDLASLPEAKALTYKGTRVEIDHPAVMVTTENER